MCRVVYVLGLLAFCVGMTNSWDFAVSQRDKLVFYTNGIETRTINLPSENPTALVYDDIRQMILYVDKQNNNDTICGYDLSNENHKLFIKRNGRNIHGLAFDTVTQTIFFTDKNERSINSIALIPRFNNSVFGNLLYKLDNERIPTDIAVDSCHGYIYWFTVQNSQVWAISRSRFDGTRREVFLKKFFEIFSLAIDLQIQKILYLGYYSDYNVRMVSSGYKTRNELRGIHNRILMKYFSESRALTKVLTVSKDYVYYTNSSENRDTVWQIQKNVRFDEPKKIISFNGNTTLGIVANYKLVDQINGLQDCDPLSSLMPTTTKAPITASLVHTNNATTKAPVTASLVHTNNATTEASVTTSLMYTSKRSDISACENYCHHGNCSFNEEELPICSCDAGYSGERCQVDACHEHCSNNCTCSLNELNEPICQCKGDNIGDRCEVSPCLNYCLQGSCSVSDNGLPECSCNAGFFGDRCEVNVCLGYCLNNGDCFLNEEEEPACQCDANHEGSRCETDISDTSPKYDASKRNQTLDYLLSILRKPSSKMYLTIEI